mgnify:CR=1 FL=1
MKVLLAAVNAKYIHSNLAVYDLKAYSSDYDEHVILREYTINQPKDEILKDIYSSGADVVCFSCYIWNISFVRELIRDLVKILPKTAFWAGGPEVSYDAEKFLTEMPEMTGVMVGEGEKTFHDLLEFYIDGKDSLEEISGIAYRTGDKIIHNGWRELMDLSAIPFVYEHLEKFENRIIYYESSRGCPFSCSYCLSSIDKKLRFRDLELVKKELQFFLDHRVPQVKFVDRTFNCKHEHAMTIWKYILEHDNGVTNFHFEISADLLREEEMELMSQMRPGLIQLEIGVQSTNPETIRAIHRHMDLKKLEHCVNRVHSFRNIHQHLDLIAGLPYEGYESFRKSFNDVYRMEPEQLQLGFLKVLKGSYMEEMAGEYGLLYKSQPPYEVLSTRWLGYDDIIRLKGVEEMVEVHYNSGQFRNVLKELVKEFDTPFDLYRELAGYYDGNRITGISHSRLARYEILYRFINETVLKGREEEKRELYRDLLMYDLYLRENAKSRPKWAKDYAQWKDVTRAYCPKGSLAHIECFDYSFEEDTFGRKCGPYYLKFDYENRNPLTNQAEVTIIQWEGDTKCQKERQKY